MNHYHAVIRAPFAKIGLRMTDGMLELLDYLPADTLEQAPIDNASAVLVSELQAYFADAYRGFTVPLMVQGTPFQRRIWAALQAIPVGTVLTYGDLAKRLGTGARAVGSACRTNPIPILIPCHRIVGQRGLGGYTGVLTGDPLHIKRWLLQHEGVRVQSA